MESLYRLLDFLDINQATDWLQRMTGIPLKGGDLLKLCNSGHCNIYVNCIGMRVEKIGGGLRELQSDDAKVIGLVSWQASDDGNLFLFGVYEVECISLVWEGPAALPEINLSDRCTLRAPLAPQFKPSELESLAAKLAPPSSASLKVGELEKLKQQLAHERSAREAAEQANTKPYTSYLLVIAALLELLKAPAERLRPQGMNQGAIKMKILERFQWYGLSERNLDTVFARANEAKKDVK